MGGEPKQYRTVAGRTLLAHAAGALRRHPAVDRLVVVVAPDMEKRAEQALGGTSARIVPGGETRQESVHAGLEAIAAAGRTEQVLIHDAARPCVPSAVIGRLLEGLAAAPGAIPVLPVSDSLVRAGRSVDRNGLARVQTPQAFRFDAILAAHREWRGSPDAGDDAEVLRASGGAVSEVPGDERLLKVTRAADLSIVAGWLAADRPEGAPPFRTGSGFDVHRLVPDRELWLGGVLIPHERGLAGHSDADVLLHALTDAILGAVAAGDIGQHFPPTDPRWAGARSDAFLAHALGLALEQGYQLSNADLTLICEQPRIGPHRDIIQQNVAALCALPVDCIALKATTTEGLGFTGRKEAIAVQASVLMRARHAPI